MTQEVKVLSGIGILTAALLIGAVFFLSNSNAPTTQNSDSPVDTKLLIKEDSQKISTDSAKVTIVEFGDYQCPACALAHPIVKQVLDDYPGKVNFVFRHFPLPQHQNAQVAAEAAEAAGEQGQYFQMHDLIYQNQKEWSENNNPVEIFVKYAKELKLNVEQFNLAVTTNKYNQKIMADKNDGLALGINSTPTFYINGKKMDGFSYSDFKKIIEQF